MALAENIRGLSVASRQVRTAMWSLLQAATHFSADTPIGGEMATPIIGFLGTPTAGLATDGPETPPPEKTDCDQTQDKKSAQQQQLE